MIVVNSIKEFAHCGGLPATVYTIFEKKKHADAYKDKDKNKDIESDLVI